MTKIVVLDAGHGLYTSGKQTMNGSKGVVKEWTLNQSVCQKVQTLLKNYDVKIYRTDDITGKTDISLGSRVSKTNAYKPDLFVSVHHNAGGGTGTEVYYHTAGTKKDQEVATILAPILAKNLACRNRGVKTARFTVLTCQATAILVEGGFMDTQEDYDVMVTSAGQQAYAEAVAATIIKFLGLKQIKEEVKPKPTPQAPTTSSSIKVGDSVKITGTTYATGQKVPGWVKANVYTVTQVEGSKALLSDIVSWVRLTDLRETSSNTSFLVQITTPVLNIRKSDDFSSPVVGTVKKGEVFTITEESNGLGKLKSGAGWISLNAAYVTRK